MRFGFATIPAQPFEALCDLVRFAEGLGFARAWIPDQAFFKDPFALLGALAQRVGRIGLGLGAVNPYTRHPALVARGAATLAEVCGGRLTLAYGAGNRRELLERLKLDEGHAGARCREALQIVRQLLAGQEVSRGGPLWPMDRVRLATPAGTAVPLYLAARGPHVLRAAGEVADGVILGNLVTPEVIGLAMAEVRRGAKAVGRDIATIVAVGWGTCIVTDDPAPVREMLRPTAGHMVATSPDFALAALRLDPGAVAAVRAAYRDGGAAATAPTVIPAMLDGLTLIDTPRNLAARLRALGEAGVSEFTVLMPAAGAEGSHAVPAFDHRKNLERFATEVAPHLA